MLLTSPFISLAFLSCFKQRERGRELERQATNTRLRLLESLLEPHMLFNTLATQRVLMADPEVLIRTRGHLDRQRMSLAPCRQAQ